MFGRSVRANDAERTRKLPGDDLVPNLLGSITHAITIRSSRQDVWPWLAQMGAGRAGSTATTSLTMVVTAAPNVSYPNCRVLRSAHCSPRSRARLIASSSYTMSRSVRWFLAGSPSRRLLPTRLGHLYSGSGSQVVPG